MVEPITAALLAAFIRTCALHYGVEPELAWAVAIVESRPAGGGMEIRVGPLGKRGSFVGPMGIAKCFARKYDIYNPYENIRRGVIALATHIRKQGSVKAGLRKYNTGDSPAQFDRYYREVCRLQRQLTISRP